MTHTPVHPKDIVSAIVTALNGTTVNGGTVAAKAQNDSVIVTVHTDAYPTYPRQYEVRVM